MMSYRAWYRTYLPVTSSLGRNYEQTNTRVYFRLSLVHEHCIRADSSCTAQATEKKLSGAAKNSFVKKCQKDAAASAKTTCEGQAADKKLAGAAKNSFLKKCEKDAAATMK
jgi:hypothetical protein